MKVIRTPIHEYERVLHNEVDARLSEEIVLYYKGQRMPLRAHYKQDQVTRETDSGMVYVDRELIEIQTRFVPDQIARYATEIVRTDNHAPVGHQSQSYRVVSADPKGNGWTEIVLQRVAEGASRRGPLRNERVAQADAAHPRPYSREDRLTAS